METRFWVFCLAPVVFFLAVPFCRERGWLVLLGFSVWGIAAIGTFLNLSGLAQAHFFWLREPMVVVPLVAPIAMLTSAALAGLRLADLPWMQTAVREFLVLVVSCAAIGGVLIALVSF